MKEQTIAIPNYAAVKEATDEFHRCFHCEFWMQDPDRENCTCLGDSRISRSTPANCICDRFKYRGF